MYSNVLDMFSTIFLLFFFFACSDGAVNFRDPTAILDLKDIISWLITEAGEGKDQVDTNSAVVKLYLRYCRNSGKDQVDAAQYYEQLQAANIKGNTMAHVFVAKNKEEKVKTKRTAVKDIMQKGLIVVDAPNESFTFYESLDVERSKLSFASNSPFPVGFGSGLKISFANFNAKHRTRTSRMGDTIVEDGAAVNIKPHATKETREQKAEQKKKKKEDREQKKSEILDQKKFTLEMFDRNTRFVCHECGKMLKSQRALDKHHLMVKCFNKVQAAKKKIANSAPAKIVACEVKNKEEHAHFKRDLDVVSVKLVPKYGINSIGVTLSSNGHDLVVEEVSSSGLAFFTSSIRKGLILLRIDNKNAFDADQDLGLLNHDLAQGEELVVEFKKPDPPLPHHGFARKGFRQSSKYNWEPCQKKFLEDCFKRNPIISSRVLFCGMQAHFGYQLREDSTPMWAPRRLVSEWIKDKIKSAKKSKIAAQMNQATSQLDEPGPGDSDEDSEDACEGMSEDEGDVFEEDED